MYRGRFSVACSRGAAVQRAVEEARGNASCVISGTRSSIESPHYGTLFQSPEPLSACSTANAFQKVPVGNSLLRLPEIRSCIEPLRYPAAKLLS